MVSQERHADPWLTLNAACIGWEDTIPTLERLREGVRKRRVYIKTKSGSAPGSPNLKPTI